MTFFKVLKSSAKELRNLRSIVVIALMIALHTILTIFSLPVTPTLRISVSFIANCVTGYFFGPFPGLIAGALGDIAGYLVKPTGVFFPGWTLSAALAGLFYGFALYQKAPRHFHENNEEPIEEKKKSFDFPAVILVVLGILATIFLPGLSSSDETVSSPFILFTVELALFGLMLLLIFIEQEILVMILGFVGGSVVWLAAYTDRKVLTFGYGFQLVVAAFFLCAVWQLIRIIKRKNIDLIYLIRVFIVMLLVALIINMGIGTYWCSVMYGKAFMVYFPARAVKNLIQLPFNTVLCYYVIEALSKTKVHAYLKRR